MREGICIRVMCTVQGFFIELRSMSVSGNPFMATSIVVGQFANLSWFRSFHDVRWCSALRASVRIAFAISADFCGIYW